ncbi:MAG TPA: RNA polymerase subunit sigma-70 [Pseudonocardiaceae bacterium]|nr:RNA polymerase subunit sigma-70 [Pseudonocardiaceae bacterium]
MTEPGLVARAVAGDESAFAQLVAEYRRPVFRHCYRMLGSGGDAEDATQDTLEKAWRGLGGYDGVGTFGAWLHRIATNVCLDAHRARRTRPGLVTVEPISDDVLLDPTDPQDELVRREEVSLAFVAALQRLAPRQRAALLLHDVLGFTHAEVAEVLDIGPTAVNSLLSRARESVRVNAGKPQPSISDPRVRQLLGRYLRAWQLADVNALVGLVTEDVNFAMPPGTLAFAGRVATLEFIETAIFGPARPHGVAVRAGSCNGQFAVGTYQPDENGALVIGGIQVLRLAMVDGSPLITEITSYRDPELAIRCGMPATY